MLSNFRERAPRVSTMLLAREALYYSAPICSFFFSMNLLVRNPEFNIKLPDPTFYRERGRKREREN